MVQVRGGAVRRRVRRYHLKRGVEVVVRFWPEVGKSWLGHQPPDRWQASVQRGPKKALYMAHRDITRDAAIHGLLGKLRQMIAAGGPGSGTANSGQRLDNLEHGQYTGEVPQPGRDGLHARL